MEGESSSSAVGPSTYQYYPEDPVRTLLRGDSFDEVVPETAPGSPGPFTVPRASSEVVPCSVADSEEWSTQPSSLKRKRTLEDIIDITAENALSSPPRKLPKDSTAPEDGPGPSFTSELTSDPHDTQHVSRTPTPPVPSKRAPSPPAHSSEPLSAYMCPICFCPPTNATLTPCGHICCGQCLFTAVRTTLQRAITHMAAEPPEPRYVCPSYTGSQFLKECRCPVCRAVLKGWDGRGGGVIGLKARAVITL